MSLHLVFRSELQELTTQHVRKVVMPHLGQVHIKVLYTKALNVFFLDEHYKDFDISNEIVDEILNPLLVLAAQYEPVIRKEESIVVEVLPL